MLVTSLEHEILSLGQFYRDRADDENAFDELKNQWGWGGFTTHDLNRCQLSARAVALIYKWWNLFVRLANPEARLEAITSRPWLMSAVSRRTEHADLPTIAFTGQHAYFEHGPAGTHAHIRPASGVGARCCGAVERRIGVDALLRASQAHPRDHRAAPDTPLDA